MRIAMILVLTFAASCGTVTTEGRDAAIEQPDADLIVLVDAAAVDAPPTDARTSVRVSCYCASSGTAYCVSGTCPDMTPTCTEQCGGAAYPVSCTEGC